MWIALESLYSKVWAIFAMEPVHLYGEKFVFSITAQYITHILKLQCHYASFGKFYKLNVWIVAASFYFKVMATVALPVFALYVSTRFQNLYRFLRIF